MARTALITGGAGDIGAAITRELSAQGIDTIILDVLPDDVGEARAAGLVESASVSYRRADTTSPVDMGDVISRLPHLDIAILCAGIVEAQPFLEIDVAVWRRTLEVNLTGAFVAAQAAARHMVSTGTAGHLVFISSWVAERPWPEIGAYSSSKAGMNQLMRTIALELSPHAIRANAIAPGIVMAGLARTQFENEPQYAQRASRAIPLGLPQTPQHIADAVGFLVSPAAATMTGSVITVDAGSSLGTLS
jgi:NAD(P)-dependent dehydrogenase (short-subunit alcohol dehydrogenase family)